MGAYWLAAMIPLPFGAEEKRREAVLGSASAKWALIGAIMVPMLMQLGISPDFTQAAYWVGDSSTNVVTPLMPYFPLVVVFRQRYVKSAGIVTLLAQAPISLALAHQGMAVMVLTLAVIHAARLSPPVSATHAVLHPSPVGARE